MRIASNAPLSSLNLTNYSLQKIATTTQKNTVQPEYSSLLNRCWSFVKSPTGIVGIGLFFLLARAETSATKALTHRCVSLHESERPTGHLLPSEKERFNSINEHMSLQLDTGWTEQPPALPVFNYTEIHIPEWIENNTPLLESAYEGVESGEIMKSLFNETEHISHSDFLLCKTASGEIIPVGDFLTTPFLSDHEFDRYCTDENNRGTASNLLSKVLPASNPFDQFSEPDYSTTPVISSPSEMTNRQAQAFTSSLSKLPCLGILADNPVIRGISFVTCISENLPSIEGTDLRGDSFANHIEKTKSRNKNRHKSRVSKNKAGRIKKVDPPNDGKFRLKDSYKNQDCILPTLSSYTIYPVLYHDVEKPCQNSAATTRFDVHGRIMQRLAIPKKVSNRNIINNPILSDNENPAVHENKKIIGNILPLVNATAEQRNGWFCLTEPIMLKNGEWEYYSGSDWDYLRYYPCAINTPGQRFIWKSSESGFGYFINAASGRKVGEKHWTLATEKVAGYINDVQVNQEQWITPVAMYPEETAGVRFNINWECDNTSYPLYGANGFGEMLYNPYSNQVMDAQHYWQACLVSYPTTSWEWAAFSPCTPDSTKWTLLPFTLGEGGWTSRQMITLVDNHDNYLSIKAFGTHWGEPYTTIKDNILPEAVDDCTAFFYTGIGAHDWSGFQIANIVKDLPSCPAKGYQYRKTNNRSQMKSTVLPPSFNLQAWLPRLYQLSIGQAGGEAIDILNTCAIQAIGMLYELIERGEVSLPPYAQNTDNRFFRTGPDFQPVAEFRRLLPDLANELENFGDCFNLDRITHIPIPNIATIMSLRQAVNNMLLNMIDFSNTDFQAISGYNPLGGAMDASHIDRIWPSIQDSPSGSLYFVHYSGLDEHGTERGHALVMMRIHTRVRDGLVAIPTNIGEQSYQAFVAETQIRIDTPAVLFAHIQRNIRSTLVTGVHFHRADRRQPPQIAGASTLSLSSVLSADIDCPTGTQRYGNGQQLPQVEDINQCSTGDGRCNIPPKNKYKNR